jgi:AcrR family transcriptional regulator
MADEPKKIPPHYAKLAWKLLPRVGSEQTKRLNTRKVVQGAIDLVNKEGLENLSIRKLSEQLGFTTMAVYRHIESREELLILMMDMGLGIPPDLIRKASCWQQAVRSWGNELLARYQGHPWLLDLPSPGLPSTPNHILWVEYILQAMQPCKLSLQQKLDAALLIDGHVRNIANLTRQDKTGKSKVEAIPPSTWLRQFIDPRAYPHFWQVLQEGVLEDEAGPELTFGLDCIITGLEARF